MGEAKFTPGPWCYGAYGDANEYGIGVALNDYDHQLSGRVDHTDFTVAEPVASEVYGEANARLIAAAPDLYEALNELLPEGWRDGVMDHMPGVSKARAALAKACPTPATTAEDQS